MGMDSENQLGENHLSENRFSAQQIIDQAKSHLNAGKTSQARILAEKILAEDKKSSEAYFVLANSLHREGKISKAIQCFKKVIELDTHHTDAMISLSVLLNDIGKYDDAKKLFNKADKQVKKQDGQIQDEHINKKFARQHFEMAEMYQTYRRYDEALFEYNKALALDPKNILLQIKIAKTEYAKGFSKKAIGHLRNLKSNHPTNLEVRKNLASLYLQSGNTLEAHAECQFVMSKDPTDREAQSLMEIINRSQETNLQ